jgi:hypothetical protein
MADMLMKGFHGSNLATIHAITAKAIGAQA